MKIQFEEYQIDKSEYIGDDEPDTWLAWFDGIKGMVASGKTKEEAFNELIISLKVKLAYENDIKLQNHLQ